MDEGCRHAVVVPSRRYEDGSVDGRCEACGEEGFPIVDVGYEDFVRADAVEAAEARGDVVSGPREEFRDLYVEEVACEVLGFPGERLPLEEETGRVYHLLTTLDEKVRVSSEMQATLGRLEKSAGEVESLVADLLKRS